MRFYCLHSLPRTAIRVNFFTQHSRLESEFASSSKRSAQPLGSKLVNLSHHARTSRLHLAGVEAPFEDRAWKDK